MKLVLLGSGTPNAEPWAGCPCSAVITDSGTFLVDCGPGVVRACTSAFYKGTDELRPQDLCTVFLTHLHSDHTGGLAELILMPWVLEREKPLAVYGPHGTENMVYHIHKAYEADTDFRNDGPEPVNRTGLHTVSKTVDEGIVFDNGNLTVEAFRVSHGELEAYGYVFRENGKKIVISGDTCACEVMKEKAAGADLLLHEAEYTAGLSERTPAWQKYHSSIHTMSVDLADIMLAAKPKLTVTYHRILHLNYYGKYPVGYEEVRRREEALLDEIRKRDHA